MINQIFNNSIFKILTLFSLSPGSRFNRKNIKEKTRTNNMPLDNALTKLMSGSILKRMENYYSINLEDEHAKQIIEIVSKEYKNLRELPLDVYFLLVDLTDELAQIKNIQVYLFGSYSKLVYSDKSDVDIAIISNGSLDKKRIEKIIAKVEKSYKKNVEVHYFDGLTFYKNEKDPLVRGIIKDGIRLI